MRRARLLLTLVLAGCTGATGALERGNRAYRDGRYEEAVEAYRAAVERDDAEPQLRYNLGTALLRLGRYEDAQREFEAALAAVEPDLRQRTLYNLGNRFLQDAREKDAQAAGPLLDAAVEAYRQALRLAPDDGDAKWNLELALREQEEQESPMSGGGDQPREPQGGQDEQEQPQGGSGGSQSASADPQPRQGGEGGSDRLPMSQAQADRILAAVEQDERQLFEKKLRKGRRETPVARDW